MPVFDKKIPFE